MLEIQHFVFNPFEENTFVVYDTDSQEALVIDPGMIYPNEIKAFDDFIAGKGLNIRCIINTHMHLDHCFGDSYVKNKYDVTVSANPNDAFLGASISQQAIRFGLSGVVDNVKIDTELYDGDDVKLGNSKLKIILVPGHTPGGIAIHSSEYKFVIVGDSLFKGSIGRTDLAGGNHFQLIGNIKNKLLTLPSDTTVLPGHGEFTTIGREKTYNPYIR